MKEKFYATVCFLTQQVAEKALKGYLIFQTANLIREHRLIVLAKECEKVDSAFLEIIPQLEILDKYYAPTRYADLTETPPFEIYDKKQSEEAIQSAEEILRFVKEKIGLNP